MPSVTFILGGTGCGKSALSVKLAHLMNAEIVNGDALQVYAGFDIGSAKLSTSEMEGVPHHGFDIVKCASEKDFSVLDYLTFATRTIEEVRSRGHPVLVVGGSSMYMQALIWESELDDSQSDSVEASLKISDTETCWDMLNELCPSTAALIHPNDTRRIGNAFARLSHKIPCAKSVRSLRYPDCHVIILHPSKDPIFIRSRLQERVNLMISGGLEEEARRGAQQWGQGKGVMQGIGYREWWAEWELVNDFKSPLCSEAVSRVKTAVVSGTWKFLLKQQRWLRSLAGRLCFAPLELSLFEKLGGAEEPGEGDVINFRIDRIAIELVCQLETKIPKNVENSERQLFFCAKCDFKFPGTPKDWSVHLQSNRHRKRRLNPKP